MGRAAGYRRRTSGVTACPVARRIARKRVHKGVPVRLVRFRGGLNSPGNKLAILFTPAFVLSFQVRRRRDQSEQPATFRARCLPERLLRSRAADRGTGRSTQQFSRVKLKTTTELNHVRRGFIGAVSATDEMFGWVRSRGTLACVSAALFYYSAPRGRHYCLGQKGLSEATRLGTMSRVQVTSR